MSLNILVVDDEPAILRATKQHLLHADLGKVTTCEDSRNAIAMIEAHSFDLILLDITMPHVSGEEILEQVHQNHPHISVIINIGQQRLRVGRTLHSQWRSRLPTQAHRPIQTFNLCAQCQLRSASSIESR